MKIEFKLLINEYIKLSRDAKILKQWLGDERYSNNVKESIRDTIKVMEKENGEQIIEIIRKNELYGKVYENTLKLLNIEGSSSFSP